MDQIVPFFEDFAKVAEFLFENLIDFILGAIALVHNVAKEIPKIIPDILDILDYLISLAEYTVELATVYWRIPVLVMTLVPMYMMVYILIKTINNLFRI